MLEHINKRTCSENHSCGCGMFQIFTENDFAGALRTDLTDAQRVLIHVPYITPYGIQRFENEIQNCTGKGGIVDIFLQQPLTWESRHSESLKPFVKAEFDELQFCMDSVAQLGAHPNLRCGIHQKVVVINDSILYVGSLNVLSYTGETREIMLRFDKKWIVEEFLHLLKLNGCDDCSGHIGHSTLVDNWYHTLLTPDGGRMSSEYTRFIGMLMKRRRKELGLEIRDLMQATGLSYDAIASAEAGGNVLRDTADRICAALKMPLHPIPHYLIPCILQYFCKRRCSSNEALREYDLSLDAFPLERLIVARRDEFNISQQDLAHKLELTKQQVMRFELSLGQTLNRTEEICKGVGLAYMPVPAITPGVENFLIEVSQMFRYGREA
jgi:transcriptional regulator with XRE-family HTH domain